MASATSKRMHRCPVAAFQKIISGKYKLRILWDLQDGPRRYGEIRSGLLRGAEGTSEIAARVLSRELKALAASGLITARITPSCRPRWNTASLRWAGVSSRSSVKSANGARAIWPAKV
jgi:DNA-binding HxlR family transcriptional regulator